MKRQLMLLAIGLLFGSASAWAQDGKYVVLFPLGKATLDSTAQATIASAKQEFDRTGSARIEVVGHTDTSGNPTLNQRLSERRAAAVTEALVRLGVPQSAITESGVGETDLAVPTGPGVKEAQNRRTEIDNFRDNLGGHSQMAGVNLGLDYKVTRWMTVGVEQAGFYHFDTKHDGAGGRSVFGPDFYFGDLLSEDLPVAPYIGGNIGYLYGSGIKDDGIGGPEIGLKVGMFDMKVAYDIPFNRAADDGIINTTIGVSFDF
jgi:hypothetical protein